MIARFKTIVPLDGNNIEFRFEPMNIWKLQLFQVYVLYEGKEVRLHMQISGNARFKFAMPDIVPPPYRELEQVLSDAIFMHCKEEISTTV
ncbi:hypothetical protein ACTHGU_10620 [Chitinophagaceae bacterium MMS25-I14]